MSVFGVQRALLPRALFANTKEVYDAGRVSYVRHMKWHRVAGRRCADRGGTKITTDERSEKLQKIPFLPF